MDLFPGPRVIIDLSWVMYRSYYTFPNFSFIDSKGKHVHTGTIYGVLRQHLALMEEFPDASYLYTVEPLVNHRYHYDPNYKAGRNHSEECKVSTFGMQSEIISMLKCFLRTYVWSADIGESDDVILVLAMADPMNTQVYSGDNDMLVLMSSGVRIFRSVKKGEIGYLSGNYIKEKFGMDIPPDSIPLYKIIRGDSSDNISSAFERFPTKILEGVLNKCKTVDELMALETMDPKILALKAVESKLRFNEKLVKLEQVKIHEVPHEVRHPRYFITNYGLKSIRKVFPDA